MVAAPSDVRASNKLEVHDLSISYGPTTVLEGVNLFMRQYA